MCILHIRVDDRVIDKLDTADEAMSRATRLVMALRKGTSPWRTIEVVRIECSI